MCNTLVTGSYLSNSYMQENNSVLNGGGLSISVEVYTLDSLACLQCCQTGISTSLVPRPSYEKIEKGSGQTCIEPVYVRNYSRAPIRFKYEVT